MQKRKRDFRRVDRSYARAVLAVRRLFHDEKRKGSGILVDQVVARTCAALDVCPNIVCSAENEGDLDNFPEYGEKEVRERCSLVPDVLAGVVRSAKYEDHVKKVDQYWEHLYVQDELFRKQAVAYRILLDSG